MVTFNLHYCWEVFFTGVLYVFLYPFPLSTEPNGIRSISYFAARVPQFPNKDTTITHNFHFQNQPLQTRADDSVTYSQLRKLAEISVGEKDTSFFLQVASQGLALAHRLKKPSLIGDAHWNYGMYYLHRKRYDSSYYHYQKAHKAFKASPHPYYAGKMLYNMAYISSLIHDHTGAEILLFEAISYFEETNKPKSLYLCYNLLGTLSDDLEEYTKALMYYQKAASLLASLKDPLYYQVELWNNIGVRYYKMNDYERAITYFEKGLVHADRLGAHPSLYAKLLDNKAFSEFALSPNRLVLPAMRKALFLRDSIQDSAGSVISRLHFAELLYTRGVRSEAIVYAKQAYAMAEAAHLNRDVLKSLKLLALLDTVHTVDYLQQHITLEKNLYVKERNLRNKFTAIKYETDKYIQENELLFKERLLIITVSLSIILLLLLIYIYTLRRAKNKALLFEREEQQYTEDLFLMAIEQKATLERGRKEERKRISEELHDGVLARLFAVRFKWSFLKLNGPSADVAQHKNAISVLKGIETEVRNISHDLRNDLFWDEQRFQAELENTLKERSGFGNFRYVFTYTPASAWESLDYLYKITISRMLEELLQNIIKHSHATYVMISFVATDSIFEIIVSDNGRGFVPYYPKKGIGLRNLKSRAQKLHGVLTLDSKLGKGTRVVITFKKPS
ncbi:tetratricopeptide repeat-containing sensor histidine kinase [Ulvibacter litoralis]|uniref:histidine kinase n=1 Tax=Ulvibacter litoralis TaxID=227084 RepID=A0A1G7JF58_9FLAO|nr:tetratricopeptide repeat-containing sensor histidine kinase [Ulvibacter litoralis]GHC64988.1 hypothetical protein GCM10008083_32860 [Ulvibacter litoralis]SDF23572.1 Signal transduction histidine kinase [Ulvibacter litoralis]